MTETEWSSCSDPKLMLEFLRGYVSERKLRLFAVSCCRRLWFLLTNEDSRSKVEEAERIADKAITQPYPPTIVEGVVTEAALLASAARASSNDSHARQLAAYAADATSSLTGPRAALGDIIIWTAWESAGDGDRSTDAAEQQAQAALLRCIFGNPYRPVAPDLAWQARNAVTLARTMYESRDFTLMPILADLLEEIGCPKEISDHCRGPGPHVRGCWVLDLFQGKE
jgi:hypothetical protein